MITRSIIAAGIAAVSLTSPVLAQVTSVSQLKDVQPTEWSYQAISNLVSRYGCVAGFPNGTFQSKAPATRAQLAALTNACLDNITTFYTESDARLASALRSEFSREISATNARVTTLEVASARKAQGVGQYVGVGVLLNKQGVDGNGYSANRTISGATVQARLPVATVWGNEVSVRPYANFVGSPAGEIGSAGGALATYDYSISRKVLANGTKVSRANVYGGIGVQVPFVNNTSSNYQSAVGSQTQVVFALGVEGRITDSLVGFADLKFPTTNAANSYGASGGTYSPVFTTGLGIKF
jgi:hypothetical protein